MRSPRTLLATVAVLAAVALACVPAAPAAGGDGSRLVTATPRNGVRLIDGMRVGPLGAPAAASTLAEVRELWGPERTLNRGRCVASWGTGVRLLFASFGGPSACAERSLQVAYVTGSRWAVEIGGERFAIGDPRSAIPRDAKLIRGWNGGGYQLATMPFVGSRTVTVMAHVGRRARIDRFVLFIGGAGD